MTDITLKTDEETLTFDVSDEALEIAAGSERKGGLHPRSLHRPDYLPKLIQRLA